MWAYKEVKEGEPGMKGQRWNGQGVRGRGPSDVSAASSNLALLRPNFVFALVAQPTTASNQRRPHTPMSEPWTCHPWVTHSSTPVRRASPSGVALSTVPAKLTAAGQANHPSAWVSEPFLGRKPWRKALTGTEWGQEKDKASD